MPVEIEQPVGVRWNGFSQRNSVNDQRILLSAFSTLPAACFEPFLTRIPAGEPAAIEEGICHPLLQSLIFAFQRAQHLPADQVAYNGGPTLLRLNELLTPQSSREVVGKQPKRRRLSLTSDIFPFACEADSGAGDCPADDTE